MEGKTIIVRKGSFGSFMRGMMIGAALALLFAPRSGRETRDLLSEKGTEIKDKAAGIARDTRERAQGVMQEARSKVGDVAKGPKEESSETKELKREVNIMEDINNPNFNL